MEFVIKPIGIIHSPYREKSTTPIQSARSNTVGTVEVYSEYQDGLIGIEGFSRIYLIYGFNQSEPLTSLLIRPFLDDQMHGLFSTRFPIRPNPIGLSIVEIISRNENQIQIRGVDMLDDTPLFDIKPYIPEFDIFKVDKIGWYESRKYE